MILVISTTERGHRLGGLVRYLFSAGRHEEHTHQRVVACSDPTWIGTTTPDEATLAQLIAELDDSRIRHGDPTRKGHVWHLIVAVPAADGNLSDTQWRRTAELFADRLGLTDDGQVAWVAVNHGRSAKGNDHIHMVVNLIRDDGRVVDIWRDAFTRRDAARHLEAEFGLTTTAAAGAGNGEALSRYEVETQRAAAGPIVLPRHRLAVLVRAAATAAGSESEFVRALRAAQVIVRPRVDKIDTTRVVGYSVALPGRDTGGTLIWFGGGTLARDLRLPALRARWPETAPASAEQWRRIRPYHARPADLGTANRALHDLAATLDWLPALDPAERTQLARDGVALLAAAASATPDRRLQNTLAAACRAVDRAVAELPVPTPPPLGLTSSVHAVRICRAVLTASRPGTSTGRLDALLLQATQLAGQITDLLLAQSQTRTALAAAEAARTATRLLAEATARRTTPAAPDVLAPSTPIATAQRQLAPTPAQLSLFGPGD